MYIRVVGKTMNSMYVKRRGCRHDSSHSDSPMRKEAVLEIFFKMADCQTSRHSGAKQEKQDGLLVYLKRVSLTWEIFFLNYLYLIIFYQINNIISICYFEYFSNHSYCSISCYSIYMLK